MAVNGWWTTREARRALVGLTTLIVVVACNDNAVQVDPSPPVNDELADADDPADASDTLGAGDDSTDAGDAGDARTDSTTSAAEPSSGVAFEHFVVDADPPSGDECCLDVLAPGDVDGDGAIDLVLGSEHAAGLFWYRNRGTDGVWDRFPIGDGDFTTDAETADVDGDGDLDVVASSIDRDVIEWWEQTGDPADGGWSRHDIGPDWAHDVVVGDLDGDGRLDVAAYHVEEGRIDWYQQPDDPTTGWTTHLVAEQGGEGLAVADLDGDGDLDLVAGRAVYDNTDGRGGEWTRTVLIDDWDDRARAVVGDVDGDGVADIVLTSPESDGRLSWFSGPDWEEHVIEDDAGYTHSVELGDVDMDGDLDLMVGVMEWAGSHLVRVLLGDGGATWTPVVLADTGTHNARLVDLDGDGRLDVVGKNFQGPKAVEIWWNRPTSDAAAAPDASSSLEGFTYVEVDDDRSRFDDDTAFFGLAFGDVDADGDADIASGGYVYLNPGGDLTADWDRVDLGDQVGTTVDAMLVTDVDGDDRLDIIAEALPDVWWIEAADDGRWDGRIVSSVPPTSRPNGQGYRMGDVTGDGRPEIVLSGGASEAEVWYISIPTDPDTDEWPAVRITTQGSDEQIGIGDIDGDGDNDVAGGDTMDGGLYIAWFENPDDGSADWERHRLGSFDGVYPDRLDLADVDGDGRLDVVVSEETGSEDPDADVMWYRQPDDPTSTEWERHIIVTQYTTNGMDVGDIDGDGDPDLVTGEHRGRRRVAIWENLGPSTDGAVSWREHVVDEGKESHLGARLADLDGDGDDEIVSIGWDEPEYLHLWIND